MAAKLFMAARQALQGYLFVFMLNIFLSSSALYKTKQNKMIEEVPKYYGCYYLWLHDKLSMNTSLFSS
jgi:hypothetical protein